MKIKQIYEYLDQLSPFELQEKWDNSGLLVGNLEDEFDTLYIAMDIDLELLEKIKEGSLVIIHHPIIFTPLKTLNNISYSQKLLKQLIKKDIALIAMHTNIDKTHLNSFVGKEVLGFAFELSDDFIQVAKINMSFDQLTQHIKEKLNLEVLKVVEAQQNIKSVALTTGSGMSLLPQIQADCFLTGDIKYHEAMEAKARGISLIDIGHYESEVYFSTVLEKLLKNYLKKNQIKAIILASQNPFRYKY